MYSSRLVVLAVSAAIVLCAALVHSIASGEGSATQPATATSPAATSMPASKPSPADLAVALKVAAMLNKCGACHREGQIKPVHGWEVAGKPVLWGQDLPRLVAEGWFVPGNPEESRLYKFYQGGGHKQIPNTPEETRLLGQWIARGCIDPKPKPKLVVLSEMAAARKAVGVLDRCSVCHRHGWQEPGKPRATWGRNIARLIEEKRVVPGKPDESGLFTIVRDGKHPKYATPELTADDVRTLDQWISQGCIDPKAKPATSKAASRPAAAGNGVVSSQ